jgi:AcrR family transcriptional regulator
MSKKKNNAQNEGNENKEIVNMRSKAQKKRWKDTVEDNKEKIINSAFKMFSEKSFDKVQIIDIVNHSMISKATIYKYFKLSENDDAKDNLYLATGSIALAKLNYLLQEAFDDNESVTFKDLSKYFLQFISNQSSSAEIINDKFFRQKLSEINQKLTKNLKINEFEKHFQIEQLKSADFLMRSIKCTLKNNDLEILENLLISITISLSTIITGFTNEFVQRKKYFLESEKEITKQMEILMEIIELGLLNYLKNQNSTKNK